MQPTSLPILPLPYPQVIFPGERVHLSVPRKFARPILKLISEADFKAPLVGAVPVIPLKTNEPINVDEDGYVNGNWSEFGCSAKIVKVGQSSSAQLESIVLQGLQRIRLEKHTSGRGSPFSPHEVTYPASLPVATAQTIAAFRTVTAKLLHRLAVEDQSTRDGRKDLIGLVLGAGRDTMWARLAKLVRDCEDDQLHVVSDLIISFVGADFEDKVDYLSYASCEARLSKATHIITGRLSLLEVRSSIAQQQSNSQKEVILRQQLAAIQRQLSALRPSDQGANGKGAPNSSDVDDDIEGAAAQDDEAELTDMKRKIAALAKGSEERTMAVREFRRLRKIPPGSVETSVVRNYLDWLLSVPWSSSTTYLEAEKAVLDRAFLEKARATLDADHYGLQKVKRRLIEYLAVLRLKQMEVAKELEAEEAAKRTLDAGPAAEEQALVLRDPATPAPTPTPSKPPRRLANKGPILLLYGPPGVGKTSIAQSLARALNRPFQRISLGGIRDEAEIRGHRRTYVGSAPGNIVQALRKAGRPDPVILLDEIDKVSQSNYHGDPAAALLEVLDPEQNWSFMDHYINVPIDLSQVLFIATANTLDTITGPLLDRCEILRLPGYTQSDKLRIAKTYLIPKQLKANGLDGKRCQIEDDALKRMIKGWTREAGVRSLERVVGAVSRAKAVEWSEAQDSASNSYSAVVKEEHLENILGTQIFDEEERDRTARRGVVYGLVVMGDGDGGILPVETAVLPGSGQLRLSGSLGDVIKESAGLALSWVKGHAFELGITTSPATDPLKHPEPIDVHLHLPAGAQKKDGPSAGIAMICAFVSLLSGLKVPSTIAMTGEITLRGAVTAVGGVKEKVLGAHRAGIRRVILPARNRRDIFGAGAAGEELGEEVKKDMEFIFVDRVEEALAAAFADSDDDSERRDLVLQWTKSASRQVESRL
ncbi:hypothetical protein FRB90_000367 [Tulasnella sp. 427]|nr:hypothetical protein FRB90_000367 [Tulasnella sp. 427]